MPFARLKPSASSSKKFFVFDTHPIQYRSPVFRALAARMPGMKVFYFSDKFDGRKWWFHEVGKIPEQNWNLDLTTGFPSESLGELSTGAWKNYRTLSALLKREKPDAVLIYGYYLPQHWMLWWLCKNLDIPLLFIGETFSREGAGVRKWLKGVLQPLFFRGIKHFVSIGSRTQSFYLSFGTPQSKITSAHYCVDTKFFEMDSVQSQRVRTQVRERLGIAKDAFVLLFVGRLFERKRPWDMAKIHKGLIEKQNITTVIVGNGPLEHEMKKLAMETTQLLCVGFKNQAETRDLYHAADLLLVPSEYETWGLVINEAFAAGLPALVTPQCGAAGDLVVEGETGFVFPIGDTAAAVEKVRWCKEHPEEYAAMRVKAKQMVISEFGIEQFAEAVVTAVEIATQD